MQQNRRNIAKIGRSFAGMTQERWAEALGYSVRSIGAWESGEQPLTNEAVIRMVDVTGQQVLAYWYLVDSLGDAARLPDVEVAPLPQAVLRLLCRIKEFSDRHQTDRLMQIAEDGKIDETERTDFDQIVTELDAIVQAAMTLKFAKSLE